MVEQSRRAMSPACSLARGQVGIAAEFSQAMRGAEAVEEVAVSGVPGIDIDNEPQPPSAMAASTAAPERNLIGTPASHALDWMLAWRIL